MGGAISSTDVFGATERMWSMNVKSSVMAGHLAANHMAENGMLVLTGAQAGLSATPGMIAYGVCKAATIQVLRSSTALFALGLRGCGWLSRRFGGYAP